MGRDLFAEEGKDLFASSGKDLFAEKAPEAPGMVEHIGGLLQNVNMMGAAPQTQVIPDEPLTQLAIGANQSLLNAPETFIRERVMDEDFRNTEENQARLAQLKGERKVARGLITEAQQGDSPAAKLVGGAIQSVPGSAASLAAVPLLSAGPAMAAALGSNMVLETAGDYVHRRDDFGQTPEQAELPALAHGGVATALEALPMGAAMKYMKGGAQAGMKTLGKVGAGEFAQEAGTSLYDDLVTNYQELTAFTPGEIAAHAGEAGLTGLLMVPMLGPAGKVVQLGNAYGQRKAQEKLIASATALVEEQQGAVRELNRQAEEVYRNQAGVDSTLPTLEDGAASRPAIRKVPQADGSILEVPFVPTAEEEALAVIQKTQLAGGLDVPATDAAIRYGLELTEGLGQGMLEEDLLGENATVEGLRDSGGVSALVQARRAEDPNLVSIPTALRPIVGAADGRVLGLTLGQTGMQPAGSVVVVGELNENFPAHVVEPLRQLYEEFVVKYMPEARVVIDLARLARDDFGRHQFVVSAGGEMTHVISPMDMLNMGRHGVSDERTAVNLMMAASHEFGHALTSQALPDGLKGKVDPLLIAELNKQANRGVVSPQVLNAIRASAPVEAAVIDEWLGLRKAIVSGKMTAAEFMEKWAGGRKVGAAVKKAERNQSLYLWAEERLGGRIEGKTALELVLAPLNVAGESQAGKDRYLKEYLSLQEYMAEQFSKHAYASGDLSGSALGRLFPKTMEKLRDMFVRLKTWSGISGEKIIKPGTTFADWMDSLTMRAKESGFKGTGFELSPALMKKQRAIVKAAGKKALEANKTKNEKKQEKLTAELEAILAGKKKVKGQAAPPKEEKGSQVDLKKQAGDMLDQLFVADLITAKMEERYRDMIARGEVQSVFEKLSAMMEKRGMMDRDYTSKVLAKLPNKERIKAETLKAYLKMQDIRATERAFWEKFLAQHPNGFSMNQAKWALEQDMLEMVPDFYTEHAPYGLDIVTFGRARVGLAALGDSPSAVVWAATTPIASDNHFGHPNYLAHSRRVDRGAKRFILEIQSDLFQKREEPKAEESQAYWDLLSEKVSDLNMAEVLLEQAEEDSKEGVPLSEPAYLYVEAATDPSVQAEVQAALAAGNLELLVSVMYKVRGAQLAQVKELQEAVKLHEDQVWWNTKKLGKVTQTWWERVIREEIAEANVDGKTAVYFPLADTLAKIEGWELDEFGTYGEMQGIYNRYRRDITKFLKKEYRAEQVNVDGNEWMVLDPLDHGEKVQLFDRDNPYSSRDPQIVLDELAGLTPEEFRIPERVAEAQDFWERLGKESPYFKRWFGNSQVEGMVWRGTGNPVAFLDTTTRGGLTGVPSAKKAFWFSDNKSNAEYYATNAVVMRKTALKEEFRRDAALLRKSISQAKDLLQVIPESDIARQKLLRQVISRDTDKLAALNLNPENLMPTAPTVRGHYLRMENPFVVSDVHYGDSEWDLALDMAIRGGHDGVIYKNAHDPFLGTVYAIFSSEQVKADSNMGTFDPTDNLHWDRDSPVSQGFRTSSKIVQKGWDDAKLRGLNALAWAQDGLIQLQQMAASQPNDPTLAGFMRVKRDADSLKNKLMGRAEETVKKLMSVTGMSAELRKELHRVLREEWKGGVLQGLLVGKDAWGNVVFGGELGDTGKEQKGLVASWEVVDSIGLRQFFQKQGVDVEGEAGKKLLEMYLEVRNTFNQEFYELGKALKAKAEKAYGNTPLVRDVEFYEIDELVFKQVASPFVPVGNFGDWVVTVKRGRETVKVVHYESETAYDTGYREALKLARNDPGVRVDGRKLSTDERGLITPLSKDFLEKLSATGEFTDEHLELLLDVLQAGKYDKINERYEKISKQMDGSNEDFARVFSDFTWHNSNFIWKSKHRAKFQDVLKAGRKAIRDLQKDQSLPLDTQVAELKRLRRNQALMDHQMNYILKPQDEFQNARGYISLAYLAFGVKTALMNLSTNFNTMAAVTAEYGEGKGAYHYGKAWKNFWTVLRVAEARRDGESVELTPAQQKDGLDPMVWAMGKALEEGIIDQSFAYFLAGQSNSNAFMRAVQKNQASALAARTLEFGMWPFQMVEKLNRIVALQTFFSAGMEENQKEGNFRSLQEVYDKASRRVDQTQNAYDPANRAKVLQGKKAILTMFMSYTLFQGHVMFGGLDRAISADISKENEVRAEKGLAPKASPNVMRSATMKLWLVFLLLSGGLGLPFAENILDVVRLLWKKLWPKEDVEVVLREYLQEMGADPNLVLHGALHDVGGFDVSGSFGLGRLIPGTNMLGKHWKTKEEAMGGLVAGASGPAGSFFLALIQSTMELTQGNVAEAGKALPGAAGAISKALDAKVKQDNRPTYGVTTKSGMRLTMDQETGEFRDLTTSELVGMAMGFTPSMTKMNREVNYRITSEGLYWQIRKSDLLDKYREAVVSQDAEGRKSVDEEILKYNGDVPSPKLRITGKTRADSLRTWKKGAALMEKYGTRVKGMRGTAEAVRDSYGDGEE